MKAGLQVSAAEFDELTSQIYRAATDPGVWESVMDSISTRVSSHTQMLALRSNCEVGLPFRDTFSITLSTADQERFRDYYSKIEPAARFVPARPPGEIVTAEKLGIARWVERTEFFNDFAVHQGGHYSAYGWVPIDRDTGFALALHRQKRYGPFTGQECEFLETMFRHMEAAARIHVKLKGAETAVARSRAALDLCARAVFIVDESLRIEWQNRAATELLARSTTLRVRNGRLVASVVSDTERIRTATRDCLRRIDATSLQLARNGTTPGAEVTISPLQDSAVAASARAGLLMVNDAGTASVGSEEWLSEEFGLTPTESRVAWLLASGLSVAEVGAELGCAAGTIRTHLKRVYRKCGVRRQAELVRLVLRS